MEAVLSAAFGLWIVISALFFRYFTSDSFGGGKKK